MRSVNAMPVLGLTGGVACGKSTAFRLLLTALPAQGIAADHIVRELLVRDRDVCELIANEFGPAVLSPDGTFQRSALRQLVFEDAELRANLEAILHPRVRSRWMAAAEPYFSDPTQYFLVEIPLLFENHLAGHFSRVISVGCSRQIQITRLIEQRHLDSSTAEAIIDAQWSVTEKLDLADMIVWNDGNLEVLSGQVDLLARKLRE